MLTKKMDIVAQTIENQILTVFPEEYVWETFSGKITLRDTILQLLAECCKYAYDNTQETHSLDFYLGGAGSADDSERMMHQRTMNYVRDKRKVQEQQLRAEGWSVNGLTLPEMKGIGEKLKGHRLNHFQFWEICNIHDMRLVKAVVDRKIGKGNFTSQNMQEISDEYDDAFQAFRPGKQWNKKKTRCVKDIYNEMSFDYKNHEFRS